jgi:hypothetical protein
MKDTKEDYSVTDWHLYDEADALLKSAEQLVGKLGRKYAKEHGKKCLDDLWYLRRLCDQHAG